MDDKTKPGAKFNIGVCCSQDVVQLVEKILAAYNKVSIHAMPLSGPTAKLPANAQFDLIICDVAALDDSNIIQSINGLRQQYHGASIVTVTSQPNHVVAVQLMKSGVEDYIALPQDRRRFFEAIERSFGEWQTRQQQQSFLDYQARTYDFSQIIGRSEQLQNTLRLAQKVIANDYMTVLLLGETGTGKELLAKAIHYNSKNREHPFVEIACSAIPETLLESELFGHEKGAFTDAKERKIGLFELAGEGTIFLDEIGDITPTVQLKMLKVIEEKTLRRLGGVKDIPVRARIIAATSRNLEDLVKSSTFRRDLYYRLKILPLELPPLSKRKEDISLLAEQFLKHFSSAYEKNIVGLTDKALEVLLAHTWEGNVRELKHTIERAALLAEKEWIDQEDLTFLIDSSRVRPEGPSLGHIILDQTSDESHVTLCLPIEDASLTKMEKALVREVLKRVNGNKSRAARIIGISRPRLDRIINLDPDFYRSVL